MVTTSQGNTQSVIVQHTINIFENNGIKEAYFVQNINQKYLNIKGNVFKILPTKNPRKERIVLNLLTGVW